MGKKHKKTIEVQTASRKQRRRARKFKMGTVVVFEPGNLNSDYWNTLSEDDRVKIYGSLGYGADRFKSFVFVTEIRQAPGHCVLVAPDTGKVEVMRHTADFRKVRKHELT